MRDNFKSSCRHDANINKLNIQVNSTVELEYDRLIGISFLIDYQSLNQPHISLSSLFPTSVFKQRAFLVSSSYVIIFNSPKILFMIFSCSIFFCHLKPSLTHHLKWLLSFLLFRCFRSIFVRPFPPFLVVSSLVVPSFLSSISPIAFAGDH